MEKKLFLPTLLMTSLLLLGVGCNATTKESADTKDNEIKKVENENVWQEKNTEEEKAGLSLSAEALGNNQVKFTWTKSDDITTDTEKGFVLIRADEENPVHNEINYWFRQSAENRETIWKEIPVGIHHFRICTLEQEKCSVYSNDVELEVK